MTSVKRRIAANFGASTLGRILTAIIQIVLVPVMLRHWGAELYGEWILLSTIPSYMTISDIGFGNAASNEMTMLVAAGKQKEALVVFQSVTLLLGAISVAALLLLVLGIWSFPLNAWLHTTPAGLHDMRIILVLLGVSAILGLQENLFHGSFQCMGKKALGLMVRNLVVLAVFAGQVVAVEAGANLLETAAVTAALNMAGTLALWVVLRAKIKWIRYGVRNAHWGTVRRLFKPALAMMSFPIYNVLSLQGILLVIGRVSGPIGVVTFNTARTISRTVFQCFNLINLSIWPEVAAAYGRGSMALVRSLHRRACQAAIFISIFLASALVLFGNQIWKIWTVNKLATDPILLDLLLLQVLTAALWYTSSVVPAATNNHAGIAKVIVFAAVASLLLSYPLMKVDSLGLRGAAVALFLGDAFTACFVLRVSLKLSEDNIRDFLKSFLQIPAVVYRRG